VAQQYLPEGLQGRVFYQPSTQGREGELAQTIARRREAQIAAMMEGDAQGTGEILTFTGEVAGSTRERWLARTIGTAGNLLAEERDRVLDAARIGRHSLVLDLRAGTGLLTWEALRRAPEGGVWALAGEVRAAEALEAQASGLVDVERPVVLAGSAEEIAELMALRGEADVRFDAVVGRNALGARTARAKVLRTVADLLQTAGCISFSQAIPRNGTRPSSLVDPDSVGAEIQNGLLAAEEHLFGSHPELSLHPEELLQALDDTQLDDARVSEVLRQSELLITHALLDRWFDPARPLGAALAENLDEGDLATLYDYLARHVGGPPVAWEVATAYVVARDTDGAREERS
jgi:putative ATPase